MYAYMDKKHTAEDKKKADASKTPLQMRTAAPNVTGIPDAIKTRFENLSGFSFDDVRVHYNSDRPAQLRALAYTQGNQVYIAPGQEKHLGHELGHVVQQKQGLVTADGRINGMPVNRSERLEALADHPFSPAASAAPVPCAGSTYPVQMMKAAQKQIEGITHAVKPRQSPRSLLYGLETRELRHGQLVTIDEDKVFLSRRGPNQELFREEDSKKQPSYYWYHLLRIGTPEGERSIPNEEEPSYVREDALVAPDQPLPQWGAAFTPAYRTDGKETHIEALSLEQRLLNRIGRIIMASEAMKHNTKKKQHEATPHVAVAFHNGEILVQGNSDYPVITTVSSDNFRDLRVADPHGSSRLERRNRALDKLQGLHAGQYHPSELMASPVFQKAQRILRGEDSAKLVDGNRSAKASPKHAEMIILDHIVEQEEAELQRRTDPLQPQPQRQRIRQLYIGGTLIDCLFCHWAFVIFNEIMTKRYGIHIVTNGTHGFAPRYWVIPQWIMGNATALARLNEMVQDLNSSNEAQADDSETAITYNIEGGIIKGTGARKMANTMGGDSDSEA